MAQIDLRHTALIAALVADDKLARGLPPGDLARRLQVDRDTLRALVADLQALGIVTIWQSMGAERIALTPGWAGAALDAAAGGDHTITPQAAPQGDTQGGGAMAALAALVEDGDRLIWELNQRADRDFLDLRRKLQSIGV